MDKYCVVHITEDASQNNFGVASAMLELVARSKAFSNQHVVTVGKDKSLINDYGVRTNFAHLPWWGRAWRYAPAFSKQLSASLEKHSVIHIHGIWMAPQLLAARYAITHSIPFVVTPHNMLGGWLWHRGKIRRVKKGLYWQYLAEPLFRHAAVIHALTEAESTRLKEFFPDTPIVTIPNGLDLTCIRRHLTVTPPLSKKYLLFLGRLHPVKGLELLFRAMAKIPVHLRLTLIVAGSAASNSYGRSLSRLANSLGIEASVEFMGLVSGRQKWSLLFGAWAVVLPSYSEGMSMVALEAMACSTPVVSTHAAGLAELPEGGGLLINPVVDELHTALMCVIDWDKNEREKRGEMSLELVRNRYSWNVIAQRYDDTYRQVLDYHHAYKACERYSDDELNN